MFAQNYEFYQQKSTIPITVTIIVANEKDAGTDNNLYIQFEGTSSRILLDNAFKNDFEKNSTNTFKILDLTPSIANGKFWLTLEKSAYTFYRDDDLKFTKIEIKSDNDGGKLVNRSYTGIYILNAKNNTLSFPAAPVITPSITTLRPTSSIPLPAQPVITPSITSLRPTSIPLPPPPQPVNCQVSGWSNWSACDKTCGGGTQTQTRTITRQASNGGIACPNDLSQTQKCNTQNCPVDCQVGDWGDWGTCNKTCGGGTQTQTRTITRQASNGGIACPNDLSQTQKCNTQNCPVDCQVGDWGDWGTCNKTCGGGTQTQTRTITRQASNGGIACPNDLSQTQKCNTQNCPVDCQVGDWGDWGTCNKTCGGGTQTQNRTITTQSNYGGSTCPPLSQTQSCNTQNCPVDCTVSGWSDWGTCNKTCGGGTQTQNRTITTQSNYGGSTCPPLSQTQSCNTQNCPVDCTVSGWSDWGTCNKTCGSGTQTQNRTITTQSNYGGSTCPPLSELSQTQTCNTQNCPVNCQMGDWGTWSACDKDCGGGYQYSTRIPQQEAQYGGTPCPTDLSTQRPCNTQNCTPVDSCFDSTGKNRCITQEKRDCVTDVDTNAIWSECDPQYGEFRMRTRPKKFIQEATNGGNCSPEKLIEMEMCEAKPYPTYLPTIPHPQPVNCQVSWSPWSDCDPTCGGDGGTRTRKGSIETNPSNGGSTCPPLSQTEDCNNSDPCPINCGLSGWSDWSNCDCNTSTQTSTLSILNEAQFGGVTCPPTSQLSKTQKCTPTNCPIDCQVNWTPCQDGEQKGSISLQPKNGGATCPPLTQPRPCPLTLQFRIGAYGLSEDKKIEIKNKLIDIFGNNVNIGFYYGSQTESGGYMATIEGHKDQTLDLKPLGETETGFELIRVMNYGPNEYTKISFINCRSLIYVPPLPKTVEDCSYMFYNCQSYNNKNTGSLNHSSFDISTWNVSQVTNMSYMFYGCQSFNIGDVGDTGDQIDTNTSLNKWNVSNVTNMSHMFYKCSSFNKDLSSWNVSKVTDMSSMFYSCKNFKNGGAHLSGKTQNNVTYNIFRAENYNPLNWNVGSVINMNSMFASCSSFNQDISNWNVSKVTDMSSMFYGCNSFNQYLSSWNVSKVTNMSNMFNYCDKFNNGEDDLIKYLQSSGVQYDSNNVPIQPPGLNYDGHLFKLAKEIRDKVKYYNPFLDPNNEYFIRKAINDFYTTDTWGWYGRYKDIQEKNPLDNFVINNWNVSNVTNMSEMFAGCRIFNQDLSSWNLSKVTNMVNIFNSSSMSENNISNFGSQACNNGPCPINCQVIEWGDWNNCSPQCGEGTQERSSSRVYGTSCSPFTERQNCYTKCKPTGIPVVKPDKPDKPVRPVRPGKPDVIINVS